VHRSALLPVVSFREANGLAHRLLEWVPARADARVLLIHGYMDAAATWGFVAPLLRERGLHVVAPDLRGYGEGARIGRGGYYYFPDYVHDVADLLATFDDRLPLYLVGHSMGGTVSTLYTGAYPETVSKLVLMEGLGPVDNPPSMAPIRMRRWIDDTRKVAAEQRDDGGRDGRPMTRAEALERLKKRHGTIASDVLERTLDHLVTTLADGTVNWAYDPLHRTISPVPYQAALFMEFAKLVQCPVLFLSGGASGWHPPDEDARLGAFHSLERHDIEGAGHMMHWTEPALVGRRLLEFFGKGDAS
jgi:pimeloyl-ACP methyl ester carboxylesterase